MSTLARSLLVLSLVGAWSLACSGATSPVAPAPVAPAPVAAPADNGPLKLDARYYFDHETDPDHAADTSELVTFSGDGTCKVADIESTMFCKWVRDGQTVRVTEISRALGPDGPWSNADLDAQRRHLPGPYEVAADGTSLKVGKQVYVLVEEGKDVGIDFKTGGGGAKAGKGKAKNGKGG